MVKYNVVITPIIDVYDIQVETDCTPEEIKDGKCPEFEDQLRNLRSEVEFEVGEITKEKEVVMPDD